MKMQLDSDVPPGLEILLFAAPGFRCAPPWAIFLRSLRELVVRGFAIDRGIFRAGLRLRAGVGSWYPTRAAMKLRPGWGTRVVISPIYDLGLVSISGR
jgi:hypothetical protein